MKEIMQLKYESLSCNRLAISNAYEKLSLTSVLVMKGHFIDEIVVVIRRLKKHKQHVSCLLHIIMRTIIFLNKQLPLINLLDQYYSILYSMKGNCDMQLIEWDKKLKLGIYVIDGQHQQLVCLINETYNALQLNNKYKLKTIMDEIIFYTKYHLSTENLL